MAGDNLVEYIIKIDTKKGKVQLNKLSKELKDTQKDLIKTGVVGKASMQKVAVGAKQAKVAISSLRSGLGLLVTGLTGAAGGLFMLSKAQADYVNQLNDTSTRTGINIKALAGLKLAAEGSGKSFSSVERGLDRFIPKMAEAASGTGKTAKFFDALGVKVTDANGKLRDGNGVFQDTIRQMAKIKDSTTKNAFAFEIFGQQAGAALIQSGAIDNMDSFIEKAEELGPALDENGIKKAAEFQTGWTELKMGALAGIESIMEGITGKDGLGASMSSLAVDFNNFGINFKNFMGDLGLAWEGLKIYAHGLWTELKRLADIAPFRATSVIAESMYDLATEKTPDWASEAGLSESDIRAMRKLGFSMEDDPSIAEPENLFQRGVARRADNINNLNKIADEVIDLLDKHGDKVKKRADSYDKVQKHYENLRMAEAMGMGTPGTYTAEDYKRENIHAFGDKEGTEYRKKITTAEMPVASVLMLGDELQHTFTYDDQAQADLKAISDFLHKRDANFAKKFKGIIDAGRKKRKEDIEAAAAAAEKTGQDAEAAKNAMKSGDEIVLPTIAGETGTGAGGDSVANRLAEEKRDLIREQLSLQMSLLNAAEKFTAELDKEIIKYQSIISAADAGLTTAENRELAEQNLNLVLAKREKLQSGKMAEEEKASSKLTNELVDLKAKIQSVNSELLNNEISAEQASREMMSLQNAISKIKEASDDLDMEWLDEISPHIADSIRKMNDQRIKGIDATFDHFNKSVDAAVAKMKSLESFNMAVNVTTEMLKLAGGDILGGAQGITSALQASGLISATAGAITGGALTILQGLNSLGSVLEQAGDSAMQEHIDRLIDKQENILGRGLEEEEIEAIKNGISEAQEKEIRQQAALDVAAEQAKQTMQNIELALKLLGPILFEVLPPILVEFAARIVAAIVKLPQLLMGSFWKGLVNLMQWVARVIVDAITLDKGEIKEGLAKTGRFLLAVATLGVSELFMDDKRKGGRFISARSGVRFTGSSDAMAQLHRNEFVVAESGARPQGVERIMQQQAGGGGINININSTITERGAIEELVRRIEREFLTFGTARSELFAG